MCLPFANQPVDIFTKYHKQISNSRFEEKLDTGFQAPFVCQEILFSRKQQKLTAIDRNLRKNDENDLNFRRTDGKWPKFPRFPRHNLSNPRHLNFSLGLLNNDWKMQCDCVMIGLMRALNSNLINFSREAIFGQKRNSEMTARRSHVLVFTS